PPTGQPQPPTGQPPAAPVSQVLDSSGLLNFQVPLGGGAGQLQVDPSVVNDLPPGEQLVVTSDPAPTGLTPQELGQLGGGNPQPLGNPVLLQLLAEADQTSATSVPLPPALLQSTFSVVLPALSAPAGGDAVWLVEVRQNGQFFGYMRFDS